MKPKQPTPPTQPEKEWLTPPQAAELMGCSGRTVLRHIKARTITASRYGGRNYRIKRSEVLRVISRHTIKAVC